MNRDFLKLPPDERNEIVAECSARIGVRAVIVEKDFWVCWMLDVLFQSSFADSLVFKGGTSLSKVFGAINRFSEDIDLSVSTELLELPEPGDSRNQANKWMTQAEAACTEAARDKFLPELEQLIAEPLEPLKERSDQDWLEFVVDPASNSPVILFHYPTTQPSGFEYLKRSVKLELGSLTEQRPTDQPANTPSSHGWPMNSRNCSRIGAAKLWLWRSSARSGKRRRSCTPNITDQRTSRRPIGIHDITPIRRRW